MSPLKISGIALATLVAALAAAKSPHFRNKRQPASPPASRSQMDAATVENADSVREVKHDVPNLTSQKLVSLREEDLQARSRVALAEKNLLLAQAALESEEARFEFQQNYAANNPGASLGVEVELTPEPPNPALAGLVQRRLQELKAAKAAAEMTRQKLAAAEAVHTSE